MPRRGGDWSGRPGHRCEVCNRSSENVGPRRGFDYANDVCGGCCEISSDDDGHNEEGYCRSCKKYMYKDKYEKLCAGKTYDGFRIPVGGARVSGAFPAYCVKCCKECQLCYPAFEKDCDPDIHPRDVDKYSVPIDLAIVEIIHGEECAVAVLGEDAKGGEIFYLCKRCHNTKWKKHPKRGQPFNGFTQEQINNDY